MAESTEAGVWACSASGAVRPASSAAATSMLAVKCRRRFIVRRLGEKRWRAMPQPAARDLSSRKRSSGTVHFKNSGGTHAATYTHRYQPQPTASPPKFVHELRGELGSRCTQRVPQRYRTTVHIQLLHRDAELTLYC